MNKLGQATINLSFKIKKMEGNEMRINEYRTIVNKDNQLTELVKDKATNYAIPNNKLSSPQEIAKMMVDLYQLDIQAEEYVYMVAFNNKMYPVGVFEISHGTVNASLLSPREIFMRALLVGAVNIVLVHNHPTGDVTPSREDILSTERIAEVGKMLGIKLIDHIIIGDDYMSLAEEGYL
jgi:DNA repair protein RadC